MNNFEIKLTGATTLNVEQLEDAFMNFLVEQGYVLVNGDVHQVHIDDAGVLYHAVDSEEEELLSLK